MDDINPSRRSLLKGAGALAARASLGPDNGLLQAAAARGAAAAVAGLSSIPLGAFLSTMIATDASATGVSVPFRVSNPHTNEKFSVDLFVGGEWNPKSVMVCHWLFRDWRENQVVEIDRRLYAALYVLQRYFDSDGFVQINSGFRSVKTNDMLRRQGYGAARESYHLKAQATDLTISKATVAQMAAVAQLFRLGGIGQYPGKNFVHLDSGPVGRIWFG